MLLDHSTLRSLFTGYKANYAKGIKLVSPQFKTIAQVIPSGTERNQYNWLGTHPQMREWIGDRVINSIRSHQYTIENLSWENTLGVDADKISDDTHGVYSPLFERMGSATALHPDSLVWEQLNQGNAPTSLSYDGVRFLSDAHPHESGTVQSNIVLASDVATTGPRWYLADLSTSLKPVIFQERKKPQFVAKTAITDDSVFHRKQFLFGVDARYNVGYGMWQYIMACGGDLNETNFSTVWDAMVSRVADNGLPMHVRPTHLIVHPSMELEARRLMGSTLAINSAGTAAADNVLKGMVGVISSPFLSGLQSNLVTGA